jgi:hypothetical protein
MCIDECITSVPTEALESSLSHTMSRCPCRVNVLPFSAYNHDYSQIVAPLNAINFVMMDYLACADVLHLHMSALPCSTSSALAPAFVLHFLFCFLLPPASALRAKL